MSAPRILIVEDDNTLRRALCDTMEFGGYEVVSAHNGKAALARIDQQPVDMVISDVQMDEMTGTELLHAVRKRQADLPFVLMTAYGSVPDAVQAIRDGATDYLQKPFEAGVLLDLVGRMANHLQAQSGEFIAEDPRSQSLLAMADKVAVSDATVLISGESGTGKEVLARYIHRQSERREGPFIALNCAAIPENMLEAMLFGYEKGAYTGAHQARPGKFEQANGGTLLLDEISEMDLELQAKLLRVLQEREVERLGGDKLIPLDVRVIATTNRKLPEEVQQGRFREDLFYRLSVFPLVLPPLRERPLDIAPLAQHCLARHSGVEPLTLSEGALAKLAAHSWRGNVRELDNCLQRAVILAAAPVVEADAIVFDTMACAPGMQTAPEASAHVDAQSESLLQGDLKDRERDLILDALAQCHGNRKKVSERLGISPRTLRYKLAKFREAGIALPGEAWSRGAA
jgi:two-component system response regulator FlrC